MFVRPCLSGLRGVRAACAACAPLVVPAVVPVCCCFLILVDCRPSMAMASMIHNTVPSAAPDGAPANTPEISQPKPPTNRSGGCEVSTNNTVLRDLDEGGVPERRHKARSALRGVRLACGLSAVKVSEAKCGRS